MAKKAETKKSKELTETSSTQVFDKISELIEQARKRVAVTINQEMVVLYWNIGKTIKKEIIKSDRADYGKQIVQSLSEELSHNYGKGFSEQSLWHMVKFYETYPILSALRRELETCYKIASCSTNSEQRICRPFHFLIVQQVSELNVFHTPRACLLFVPLPLSVCPHSSTFQPLRCL